MRRGLEGPLPKCRYFIQPQYAYFTFQSGLAMKTPASIQLVTN